MNSRTLLISLFLSLILITGCDGPAEQAGEDLDAQVTATQSEVAEIKQQITDHEQTIAQTREELAAGKEELAIAKKELEEMKLSRDEILQQMENLQEESKTESTPVMQQDVKEQSTSSLPAETGIKTPDESTNGVQQEKTEGEG